MSKLKKLYWSQAGMETRTNTPQGCKYYYRGLEADAETARLRERLRELEELLGSCLTSLAAVASFEYSLLMWSGWAKDARERVAETRAALEGE